MKKVIICLLMLISNLLFSIDIKTAAQDSEPKFFIKPNEKEIVGICVDVMKEIEKIDSDIKFKGNQIFLPFNRIENEVENGILDCFVGFAKNEEREKKYIYIDIPVYNVKNILISKKDEKEEIKKIEDIKKIKDAIVIVAMGTYQADMLKARGYKVDDSGKNSEIGIKKLLQNRGRFVYASEIEIMSVIKRMGVKDKIKIQPLIDEKSGRYIAFFKGTSQETIDKVTKALEKLRDNGKLDEIFNKYVR